MQLRERISPEQFEAFINQPENSDKRFEYIEGAIVDVPNNTYSSKIAGWILTFINMYLLGNRIGHTSGEGGGYWVAGQVYAPDVAFISLEKEPDEVADDGFNQNLPDLAVEVISVGTRDELTILRLKITNHLSVGCVVWVVDPKSKTIEVHKPSQAVRIYHEDDTLTGDDVLPNFELPVADIFKQ